MRLFKFIADWFAVFCVGATLLGLLVPEVGAPIAGVWPKFFLAGILFFTGLKLDFREAGRALSRPWTVVYLAVMLMVVLPMGVYGAARLFLPTGLAVGVMIVAAMPAGLACSSLTDIARGNAALALVVTMVTSLLCPLTTPWIIRLGCGAAPAGAGKEFLLAQAVFLAAILFSPMGAAWLVRSLAPGTVARFREAYTGLSVISLTLLILGAMSGVSVECMTLVREKPLVALTLALFMFGFSAALHLTGYFLAFWRPVADRAAISVNAAYVNNGLAIVFASTFYVTSTLAGSAEPLGADVVMPAILLEIPMILAILPLKLWVRRSRARCDQPGPQEPSTKRRPVSRPPR